MEATDHHIHDTNIYQCSVCRKVFSANFNLRKHIRKFHPDKVNVLAPSKAYNFQCPLCNRNFTQLKHFRIHERRHNTTCPINKKEKKCAICDYCGLETDLLDHFTRIHHIELKHTFMQFVSLNEFHTWKTDIEHDSRVQFIRKQKPFMTKCGQVFKYVCHRSGTFNSKSMGLRRLKSQGSKKIGGFCPASMKVVLSDNGKCEVTFMNTHVGHGNDVDHLWLSFSERESLAGKIARRIPFNDILVEAHDGRIERVKRLKRKDLHNIKRSFGLQSVGGENRNSFDPTSRSEDSHQILHADEKDDLNPIWDNDSAPEDLINNVSPVEEIVNDASSLLQERKEKLKTYLSKFVDEIRCVEEADALEEAFARLMSTNKKNEKRREEDGEQNDSKLRECAGSKRGISNKLPFVVEIKTQIK